MYADQRYWDDYFRNLAEAGSDLNWGGQWTDPFIPLLTRARAQRVLELGCGSGNDAARLVAAGFSVDAVDLSREAIEQARRKHGHVARWIVADIAHRLPVDDGTFDAVMANVALHMFDDRTTRRVFREIGRVVKPSGLVLCHVNAHDDRPLRALRRPVLREIEPNYVLEEQGQTVRFFSREYLLDLLADWTILLMEHVEIADRATGKAFKRVWRVAARSASPRAEAVQSDD